MNKINYQRELEKELEKIKADGLKPRLLLHSCCAPCSSYVLEYLSQSFLITVLYYNPNISPIEEYNHRKAEQIRLINEGNWSNPVKIIDCDWDGAVFEEMSIGLEDAPEGGDRCFKCYELRLRVAAETAARDGYDYFATTLTLSPLKNAQILNEIGIRLGNIYKVKYLPSDFKKKNGYKRSVELSAVYGLYRQNYCGCVYSKQKTR